MSYSREEYLEKMEEIVTRLDVSVESHEKINELLTEIADDLAELRENWRF